MQAQTQVYHLFAGKLFALSLKYSRNYHDAEDVLQDSFIIAFNKMYQYESKGSFEGWLKRIVVNTALQRYREKSPLQLVKDEQNIESKEDILIDVDETKIELNFMLELIQQLPDRYRLVFNLYVLDNFSHKEIANMLEISEGTSKSNLSRARLILKRKIEDYQQKQENA
ncbi:RNA polymerase sigma-70 factor (ECF subfamily) [Tenacibaculum adriaticum]|uniref:RNA polymerase sigma-70 factor (ECF subfamily) n=1 Tax=Tenacibaculum adriaticum TaxID=413713 RepID=A0A5S5DVT5_9FLAO|nr:RNA polymerase sigma-70 factor (ECF subfamily) [Tenacibaculum adriaticum]